MESKLPQRVREQTLELENANEAQRQSEQILTTELRAAQHLQHVATQLISTRGTETLYEQILDTAMAIMRADLSSIQMFYPERGANGELRLLGHRGFNAEAAKRWEWVRSTTRTTCGEALRTGRRVAVPDVRNCDFMSGSDDLDGYLGAEIHAGQTTPLVSRSGDLLGMVSTYWREPHELAPSELRSLDVLARMAADLIERSRAEEKLRENEQRLVSIYNTVRDVIFHLAVEPEGQFRFVSVNAAFTRVTGLSLKAVIGKTVHEVIPEPSLTMVLGKYRQAIEEKTVLHWEETSDYPGGRLTGEVSVVPVFDNEGTCTHLVGSVHDLTERKQAETLLRENDEREKFLLKLSDKLRSLSEAREIMQAAAEMFGRHLEVAIVGYLLVDPDGDTYNVLASYSDGRLPLPHTRLGRISDHGPGWRPQFEAGDEIFSDNHETCSQFAEASRAFGIRSGSAVPLLKGGRLVALFTTGSPEPRHWTDAEKILQREVAQRTWDAVERARTEEALRESEEQFRRVFEEGPLGIALAGKDHHFVKVNSALCQMVGYSEAELLQKSFVDITHPDDVQADVELAERLFRLEIPFYKWRKRYVKKNGEIIWINLTKTIIRDQEGQPIHGLAMIEDITEVKRAQEEALARQKLESVGVLAGGIAHDFNNLLGGILASTELALTECAEGSAVEEELQRIKTSSVRGAEIVRELMIYGGEESPNLELVDMSALVNEMLQLLKVSISKHAILKIELGQDLPPVQANPAQIRQVVMNLVTNASEAIGERSGEIRVTSGTVKIGPGSPARGGIDLAEGDYLRLEIFDTGRGMTPEVQARIFDPFFSTKRAGRGLGLAAVQGVIRSHGGMINVESAPGQGSRFEILLPCFDQATQKTKGNPVTPSAQEPGTIARTVLVVEDEEILRLAVSKMLRKSGFSVIEAGDGTTGTNLFRANERKIDVVLLDMTLPGMSGREVLEELRRIQPGVKVILTTAFSQASTLSSIAEEHLWGYVRKPYQLSELASLLRKACLDEPKITGHVAGSTSDKPYRAN